MDIPVRPPPVDPATMTVRDLLAMAERGEKQPVWEALHRLLRVAMRDECGEVIVLDESEDVVCYVSSRRAHEALIGALMDSGVKHEELCDLDSVLNPRPGS